MANEALAIYQGLAESLQSSLEILDDSLVFLRSNVVWDNDLLCFVQEQASEIMDIMHPIVEQIAQHSALFASVVLQASRDPIMPHMHISQRDMIHQSLQSCADRIRTLLNLQSEVNHGRVAEVVRTAIWLLNSMDGLCVAMNRVAPLLIRPFAGTGHRLTNVPAMSHGERLAIEAPQRWQNILLVALVFIVLIGMNTSATLRIPLRAKTPQTVRPKSLPEVVSFVYAKNGFSSICTGNKAVLLNVPIGGLLNAAYKWDDLSDCPLELTMFRIRLVDDCTVETLFWEQSVWKPYQTSHAFLTYPVRVARSDLQAMWLDNVTQPLRMQHLMGHQWNQQFICPGTVAKSGRGAFDLASSEGGHSLRVGTQVEIAKWHAQLSPSHVSVHVPGLVLPAVRYYEGKYCSLTHRFATADSAVFYYHPFGLWVPYMRAEVYDPDHVPLSEDRACSSWQGPQFRPHDYLAVCEQWILRQVQKRSIQPCSEEHIHEVVRGETLTGIAVSNAVTMSSILAHPGNWGRIPNWDDLPNKPGFKLVIPRSNLRCVAAN